MHLNNNSVMHQFMVSQMKMSCFVCPVVLSADILLLLGPILIAGWGGIMH